jgi:hypothetical protein
MLDAAQALEFERAAILRDEIAELKRSAHDEAAEPGTRSGARKAASRMRYPAGSRKSQGRRRQEHSPDM